MSAPLGPTLHGRTQAAHDDAGARRRSSPALVATPRRLGRPNPRALLGGFLIAAAVVVIIGAWLQIDGNNGSSWVVARHALAAGTTLDASDLTTETIRLPSPTKHAAFASAAPLAGRKLAAPVATGELIQKGDLVPAGASPAVRPVSVGVSPANAGGVSTGDLVDVLVTNGTSPTAPTQVVVYGAHVLAINQASSGLSATNSGYTVTLGVQTFDEARAVIHAATTGTVALVEGEPGDGHGLGPGAGASPPG